MNRDTIKNRLSHESYLSVYRDDGEICDKQRRIGSTNHQLYTMQSYKKLLDSRDDKRSWIAKNESLAYGHWRLMDVDNN